MGELRPTASPPHSATSPLASPASPSAPVRAVSEFTVVFRSKILHKAAECWPAVHHPLGMAFSFTTLWQTPDVFLWPANTSQKQSELPPPTSPFLTRCQTADGKGVSPLPQLVNYKIRVGGVLGLEATIFLRNCKYNHFPPYK